MPHRLVTITVIVVVIAISAHMYFRVRSRTRRLVTAGIPVPRGYRVARVTFPIATVLGVISIVLLSIPD